MRAARYANVSRASKREGAHGLGQHQKRPRAGVSDRLRIRDARLLPLRTRMGVLSRGGMMKWERGGLTSEATAAFGLGSSDQTAADLELVGALSKISDAVREGFRWRDAAFTERRYHERRGSTRNSDDEASLAMAAPAFPLAAPLQCAGAFTIASVIFLASPNNISVLSRKNNSF